jgi:hypothetical protein
MMEEITSFEAEFYGAPVNRDGIVRIRLSAPYSETGRVTRLLMVWTKEALVTIGGKKRSLEGEFVVEGLAFKRDGSSVATLAADARTLSFSLSDLARLRHRSLKISVRKKEE